MSTEDDTPDTQIDLAFGLTVANIVCVVAIAISIAKAYEKYSDPDVVAEVAVETIEDNYSQWKDELVAGVRANAPETAEKLSRNLRRELPELREEVGGYLASEARRGIARLTEMTDEDFRALVRDNRAVFETALAEIDEAPEDVTEASESVRGLVEDVTGGPFEKRLDQLLEAHRSLNERLARLAENRGLSPTELIERRIVRIVRTLGGDRVARSSDDSGKAEA